YCVRIEGARSDRLPCGLECGCYVGAVVHLDLQCLRQLRLREHRVLAGEDLDCLCDLHDQASISNCSAIHAWTSDSRNMRRPPMRAERGAVPLWIMKRIVP